VVRNLVLLTLACLVLSGCSGSDSKAQETPGPSTEPAGPDSGAIYGMVTNDEGLPVSQVTVGVVELNKLAKTGEDGVYRLSPIPPGDYKVVPERLGYTASARMVKVVAGEETKADFVLKAIPVAKDPVVSTIPYAGVIQCSVNPVWPINPCNGITGTDTSRFWVKLDQDLPWSQSLLEATWTPSTAATSQRLELDFCDYRGGDKLQNCDDSSWTDYASGGPPLRTDTKSPFTGTPKITNATTIELGIGTAIASPYPVFQQSFNMYLTHCYVAECPEDYSGLPPPA
jgi:hypothetical protein